MLFRSLHSVFKERIGANYFLTLGVPLVSGREFDRRDEAQAILNQTAARELFGSADPIGRRFREDDLTHTVVGLARDMQPGFQRPSPVATVFLPLTADAFRENPTQRVTILVRGTAGRDTLAAVRAQMASLHPDLTIFNLRTLQDFLDQVNSFFALYSSI